MMIRNNRSSYNRNVSPYRNSYVSENINGPISNRGVVISNNSIYNNLSRNSQPSPNRFIKNSSEVINTQRSTNDSIFPTGGGGFFIDQSKLSQFQKGNSQIFSQKSSIFSEVGPNTNVGFHPSEEQYAYQQQIQHTL